jgi:hypothetical protein
MIFIEIRKAQNDTVNYWQILNLAYEKFPDYYAILTEYAVAKIKGGKELRFAKDLLFKVLLSYK